MLVDDIRQSDNWSNYLKIYGWQSVKLENSAVVRINDFLMFKMAKLYRPRVLNDAVLKEVDSICKENKVLFAKISPVIGQDEDLLKKFGYMKARRLDLPSKTMFINLDKDTADLWKELRKGCRYSINRSERDGDWVEFVQNPSEKVVKKYYEIISLRAKKKNYFCNDLKDQLEKVRAFGNESFIVNVYNKSGDALGTKLFLGYKKNIWYIHSGTTGIGQKSNGGHKSMWDSIRYFKEKGYKVMDLEGLYDARFKKQTKKWKGYTAYKKRFNGEVVEFPVPRIKYFNVFSRL